MKITILTTFAVSALLAIAAHGQGAGGAGGAGAGGTAGAGTGGAATSGSTGIGTAGGVQTAPGNNNNGVTPGVVTPANPNPAVTITPPVNPNTPVVGGGMGANNLNMGPNNLSMGTNRLTLGSNQFALRTNGLNLGTNSLAPTGSNGSRYFLSNNVPVNPVAATNRILLR